MAQHMDYSLFYNTFPKNKENPVWAWWDQCNDAAPPVHKEMFYALRTYAEKKFRGKLNPYVPLYYVAACKKYPPRVTINSIRESDSDQAWNIFHELKDSFTVQAYHRCALRSTMLKPLVRDVAEEVAPNHALRAAWIRCDESAFANVQTLAVVPNPLYTEMRRMRVKESLRAVSNRLSVLLDTDPSEEANSVKLAKKSLTLLNKLSDELILFAMREVYPSPEFISAVFRHYVPLCKDLKCLRKSLMAEARLEIMKKVVSRYFDIVTALALAPKGPVTRVLEYKHTPVVHQNKRRCTKHV